MEERSQTSHKIQYLAGLSASFAFVFTGVILTWGSPAIPKIRGGEANFILTDTELSWVASLPSIGSLPGCCFGQVLIERIGRRKTILFATLPHLVGSGMILFTQSAVLMGLARTIVGFGLGITAVVTMIYLTEIADKEIRGTLGMLVQVMFNLGNLIMYGIGPFVSYTVLNWIVFLIPVITILLCYWIPESPYYHLKDGRIEDAKREFMILKDCKDEKWIEDQLSLISAHVSESMENRTTLKELLVNIKYRKAIYIVIGLKLAQNLNGFAAIQSYLGTIFRHSTSISGAHVSIIFGFVQLGTGLLATFLAGRYGRRGLMISSSLGVSVSLAMIGVYFFLQDYIQLTPDILSKMSALPLVGIFGFNILYSVGIGLIPQIMQTELFPINVKTLASSIATMMSAVLVFGVVLSYRAIRDNLGLYTVFWIFAVTSFLGALFVYFFVPETKGKTLEEIIVKLEGIDRTRHLSSINRQASD